MFIISFFYYYNVAYVIKIRAQICRTRRTPIFDAEADISVRKYYFINDI